MRLPRWWAALLGLVAGASGCSPPPGAPPVAPPAPLASAPGPSPDQAPPAASGEAPPASSAASGAEAAPLGAGWQSTEQALENALFEAALSRWSPTNLCPGYDYFPSGGIQSFWCHRPETLTVSKVRSLAGVDIFASGPHGRDDLKLDDPGRFGHYNPAFVRWLVDKVAPAERGSLAQKATQASYEANLRPLAEIFWKTLEKLRADEACFSRERSLYKGAMARMARGHHERWFFFMNPSFCRRSALGQVGGAGDNFFYENGFDANFNGNVTKAAVGFWMRRSLDGTLDTFAEGLKKLITSYQPRLIVAKPRLLDPDEASRAVAAAVKAASTCKGPSGPAAISVSFSLDPDGRVGLAPNSARALAAECLAGALASVTGPAFDANEIHFTVTEPALADGSGAFSVTEKSTFVLPRP